MNLPRQKKLYILIILTGVMFVGEIGVGYYTSSIALIADSFHMLSDVLSLLIAIYAIKLAKRKKRSVQQTYGWQRVETVAAMINATFLLALCFTIYISAIQRLISPQLVTRPFLVLVVGCAGLVINIFGLILFREHSHGHSHGEGSLNMKGVFLHVLGDALGSIGVITSALVIWLSDWSLKAYVDPVASLIITTIIVFTALPLFKSAADIILHFVPNTVQMETLKTQIIALPTIRDIHEFHVWQLDDNKFVASIHAIVSGESFDNHMRIMADIKGILHSHKVHNSTIQLESGDSVLIDGSCMLRCEDQICIERSCCEGNVSV